LRVAGKVVRFDSVGGYGFIAPDGGGDDVFLHVNDLEVEKSQIRPGVRVTFGIDAGERGKFATAVRLTDALEVPSSDTHHPRSKTVAEEEYYDVLSVVEFGQLVTELLLHIRPALDAEQILQAREKLTEVGRRHGWLDEA
jgi:CspA family cold shock protein